MGGERDLTITMTAEEWSHVKDVLHLAFNGHILPYELQWGSSHLIDAMDTIDQALDDETP